MCSLMTRSMNKPDSPKHRYSGVGTRHSDGSVYKRQPVSPASRSMKLLTNGSSAPTQQDCVSKLKKLLPSTNEEEDITELALVEKTIAYISYLENILSSTNSQDLNLQSTVDLLQKLTV